MKLIDVPKDVTVDVYFVNRELPKDEKSTNTFREFVELALDNFDQLGKGYKNVVQAVKIHSTLKGCTAGDPLQFEDDDFKVIKDAVEKMAWKPGFARQALSFFEAIENAQDVKTPQKT